MDFDKEFYGERSWGAIAIKDAKDLPTLKLKRLMALLSKRKNKQAKLLEIGCGSGRILHSIRQRDKSISLTGIDLSTEQIKLAQQAAKGKNITFQVGDGQKIPFPDKSFDYVIIMDFLEHIPKPQQSLNEAKRILKPGGYLYAVIPAEGQVLSPYWVSMKVFRSHFKETTAGHIQQFKIKELEQMTRKAGLQIKKKQFSYHLFGSIMDYALFTLLLNKRIAKVFWSKNKYYKGKVKQSAASRVLNGLMTLGNGIAYAESTLLGNTKIFATAVHITAQRGDR